MSKYEVYLSVILPAFNEEACIYMNVLEASKKVASFCDSYEILVADDGSSDRTLKEALRASAKDSRIFVLKGPHGGKGRAVCVAAQFARGKYIAFCDADMDVDPAQLGKFLEIIKKSRTAAVIGSKLHPKSNVDMPFFRKICSRGYAELIKLLLHCPVNDTQTGLKLFRSDVMKAVCRQIQVNGYAFDAEMISLICARGFKVESVPVEVSFTRAGVGRIGLKDVWNVFIDTLGIFIRLRLTHYYRKNRVNEETARAAEHTEEIFPAQPSA